MYLKEIPFINKVTIPYHTTVLNFIYFSKSAEGDLAPTAPPSARALRRYPKDDYISRFALDINARYTD